MIRSAGEQDALAEQLPFGLTAVCLVGGTLVPCLRRSGLRLTEVGHARRLVSARELYERVLEGRRRTLGDQHPDIGAARRAAEHLNDQLTAYQTAKEEGALRRP